MNRAIKIGIIVAVLFLAIGFAVISTNLNLIGEAGVRSNNAEFAKNIKFTKCEPINAVNVDTENIICEVKNDKTIEFDIPVMSKPGSLVTLEYTINNANSDYDSLIGKLNCEILHTDGTALRDTETRYISITPNNSLNQNGGILPEGESTDSVTVKMAKTYSGDEELKYKVSCSVEVTGNAK